MPNHSLCGNGITKSKMLQCKLQLTTMIYGRDDHLESQAYTTARGFRVHNLSRVFGGATLWHGVRNSIGPLAAPCTTIRAHDNARHHTLNFSNRPRLSQDFVLKKFSALFGFSVASDLENGRCPYRRGSNLSPVVYIRVESKHLWRQRQISTQVP